MSWKSIITLVIFIGIIVYAKSLPPQKGEVREASDAIATPTQEPTPTETPTPTIAPLSTQTPLPPSGQARPTSASQPQSITTTTFLYPNARQVSGNGDTILLETSDNPDTVTSWYENRIKSFSMNAKSFVKTSTNGNVLNKLIGDNGKIEAQIEITKRSSDSVTKISVSVEPS